ncbi:MAG: peroxide stress protein YaaA [Legionella sp.]|nr:peroxide stress protein YaaA [Legionella sp.]
MLTLLSPAKRLLIPSSPYTGLTTKPVLNQQAVELAKLMKKKSAEEIGKLMSISKELSVLNYERFQEFDLNHASEHNSYPAGLLFQGDVYQGLEAGDWSAADFDYAQDHLGILSGLYGLLKPLDLIQPYRLEMGIRLKNPKGANLYDFWRDSITKTLNQHLKLQKNPVLINLASNEYFKAVDARQIEYPIVTVNFYENKNNEIEMIGVYAKKARGIMARYIIKNRVHSIDEIKKFKEEGYVLSTQSSSGEHLDFIRKH